MSTGDALARLAERVDFLASSLANETAARLQLEAASAGDSVALDVMWLYLNGVVIFSMQFGFCMLEAGAVTSKSTESIMMKNACDCAITALMWWTLGYGFAFGDGNALIGGSPQLFASSGVSDAYTWSLFFFHLNFAATASTIVSGAIAERAHILSYLCFSSVCAVLIYPVVAHWQWSTTGWASAANPQSLLGGLIDFAGGGAVHVTGGIASFCGAAIIGPRPGRFMASAPTAKARRVPLPMPGHSSVLIVMGTFILWFGWYGFNAGSTLHMDADNAMTAARVAMTTTLSGAGGGMTAVLLTRFFGRAQSWEVTAMCNGCLTGLVSITSGCATVEPWAALLIGCLGAGIYLLASKAVLRFGVDDPLDAEAVHGTGGAWALFSTAVLSTDRYTAQVYGPSLAPGLLYTGSSGERLCVACIFIVALGVWVGLVSTLIFLLLKKLGILRAPDKLGATGEIDMDASIAPPTGTAAVVMEVMEWDPPISRSHSPETTPAQARSTRAGPGPGSSPGNSKDSSGHGQSEVILEE